MPAIGSVFGSEDLRPPGQQRRHPGPPRHQKLHRHRPQARQERHGRPARPHARQALAAASTGILPVTTEQNPRCLSPHVNGLNVYAWRADYLLRDDPAAAHPVAVHLLRRRPERRVRDDPEDLQPLLHDQRRTRDPGGRRRRRHRRGGRPPRRLLPLHPGRETEAHLLLRRRVRVQARVGHAAADRERHRADGVRCRRAQAGHRRPGDAVHQRQARRERPDGAHRPRPLHRLRGHGHRPGQRHARRPQLRGQVTLRIHRHGQEVIFDINPHPSDEHEQNLHEHAHQALAGHAITA